MGLLDPTVFLTPGAIGAAIDVTVANIASPTELNSRAAAQGDIILARTVEAGTGTQTWYYADTTSASEDLPYVVSSATAGVKFIAFGGRYSNEASGLNGAVTIVPTSGTTLAVNSTTLSGTTTSAQAVYAAGGVGANRGFMAGQDQSGYGFILGRYSAGFPAAYVQTRDTAGGSNHPTSFTIQNESGSDTLSVGTVIATGSTTAMQTTDSTSSTTGGLKTSGGLGVAKAIFGGSTLNSVGALTSASDTDSVNTVGRMRLGLASGGSSDYAYAAHFDQFTGTNYALAQGASGDTYFNCATGQSLNFNFANGSKLTINGTTNTFNSTNETVFASTTDATSSATGGARVTGGLNVAKNLLARQGSGRGLTSTASAAGTTTLTNASTVIQIFTGATTQTLQLAAANLFGANIAVEVIIINRSSGTVTAQRAGSDTFDGGGTTDAILTNTTRHYFSNGSNQWHTIA